MKVSDVHCTWDYISLTWAYKSVKTKEKKNRIWNNAGDSSITTIHLKMPPIKQEHGHLAGKSSLNNKLCTWFRRERCDFLSNLKNGWQTHTHIHSNLNKRFILIKLIIKWQWHAQRKQKLKIYTTLSERRNVWIPNEKSFMEFFHQNTNTPYCDFLTNYKQFLK